MNEKQRDLFLWVWSRRRARGRLNAAIAGGLIGAFGGVLFTAIFFWLPTLQGETAGTLNTSSMPPFLAGVANSMKPNEFVLLLAALGFAAMGFVLAYSVYAAQEAQFQTLLAQGAKVPEAKPQLTAADRGPLLAVIATIVLIAGFIAFLIIQEFS